MDSTSPTAPGGIEAEHEIYITPPTSRSAQNPGSLGVGGVEDDILTTAQQASGVRFMEGTFRDGEQSKPTDVFIAVMGVTGAGKSTLISLCTNNQLQIGHSLQGCTKEVSVHLCKYRPDVNVYLIDTPGFDDTNRSDTIVLREITAWLTASYSYSIKLHGIIYLHRITDLRMQGSARRNLFLFKKLCGPEALKNVILATTMWELVDSKDGEARERELESTPEFWGSMKDKGSKVIRHHHTRDSAMRLIQTILDKPPAEATIVLDVQSQMVEGGKTLAETSAGEEMAAVLTEERKRFEKELKETRAEKLEAVEAQDKEAAEMLAQHERETDERIRRLTEEQANLRITMEKLHQDRLLKMEANMAAIKAENRKTVLELEKARQEQDEQRDFFQQTLAANQVAERTLSHTLEETQKRLSNVGHRSVKEPSPKAVDCSLALFGVFYTWVGPFNTKSHAPPGFPSERQVPNSRNKCVSIGEDGSYYIHYHTMDNRCCTLLSKNFSRIYPGAHRHIIDNKQFGCPTCVSLGTDGHGFIRTEGGCWHKLRRSTTSKLGDMGQVESLWLGYNGAYVSVDKAGVALWDLKGGYPGLQACLQSANEGQAANTKGTAIKALAMNPHDAKQWLILFRDGRANFNEGKGYTFDGKNYIKWCTENFGALRLIPAGSGDDSATPNELDAYRPPVELGNRREFDPAELDGSPATPHTPAELEGTEPARISSVPNPHPAPGIGLGPKPSSASLSSVKSRFSRLGINRKKDARLGSSEQA